MQFTKGTTSQTINVFIPDSSSTTGAGLSGLVYNSGSLTCYYIRQGDSASTAVTLATATVGTWTSSGFKEIDATNMKGLYEFGIPNACLATGANMVTFIFRGATNMAPVALRIKLTNFDDQDSVRAGLTAIPNAVAGASGGLPLSVDTSGRVDVLRINGTSQTARDIGASVLISSGSGTGQLDVTSGVVKSNLSQILGTALTETAGYLAAAFKKFFNIPTPASTMDALTLVGTATNLTNAPTAGDLTATMKASVTTAATAATPTAAAVTGAVGSVTGITASDVGAIKAKTDNLPASPASTTNITAGTISTVTNLTNLPSPPTDWLAAAAVKADAVTKIQAGLSTYAGGDTSGTTTLLTRIPSAITLSSGAVTVGTNNDKTGYTVSTVSDKTGYSLTQTFPANFSSLTISGGGAVTFGNTTIATVTTLTNLPSAPTDWLTGAAVKADAVTKIQSGLSTYAGGDTSGTTTLLSRIPSAITLSSGAVTVGTNNDKTGYSLTTSPPTAATIASAVWQDTTAADFTTPLSIGKSVLNGVTLGTGLTINGYTGDTPQTGDTYARIGSGGAGLTALGDSRITNLDAAVSSRMATYTQPSGFLSATFPSGTVANTTNITGGTITTATNLTNLPSIPANWLTATGIAASALNGKGDWNIGKTGYALATNVWDETLASHLTSGTTGAALNAAGSSGDPWATSLPGAYGVGTAGHIVGISLDATVSSRMTTFSLPTNFAALAISGGGAVTFGNSTIATVTNLTNLPGIPANWLTATGIASNALNGKGDWNTTTPPSVSDIGTQITSDHGAGSYVRNTEPDNTSITAIKLKTDNLPGSPAATGDAMTLTSAYDAAKTALQSGGNVVATNMRGTDNALLASSYVAPDNGDVVTVLNDLLTLLARTDPTTALSTLTTLSSAIKTKTDNLPASPAATGDAMTLTNAYDAAKTALQTGGSVTASNMRGTDNALLASNYTAPDNTSVATALSDLVALLARTDPTTALGAVKIVTDKLATALQSDGDSGYQFTTTALAEAPAGGGGGGGPTVDEIAARIITDHGTGSYVATGAGSGAYVVTVTVVDADSNLLQNATICLTEGINSFRAMSAANGTASFALDAATYTISITKSGYQFTPATVIITGNQTFTQTMTMIAIPAPSSDASLCRVYGYFANLDNTASDGLRISFSLSGISPVQNGSLLDAVDIYATISSGQLMDANGDLWQDLLRNDSMSPSGTTYLVTCPALRLKNTPLVLAAPTFDLTQIAS